MTKQTIFNTITTKRKEKAITQVKLSKKVGMSEKNLIANLKGYNKMSLDTFLKICDILEIKLTIEK